MFNFLHRRTGPQSDGLHYSFEKAGLVLVNQPIPWNAEAVVVEALVRVQAQQQRSRDDFILRVAGREQTTPAESLRAGDTPDLCRVFFRLPVPALTTAVEVLWRGKSLGQLTLPIISAEEYLQQFALEMPTLAVQLGGAAPHPSPSSRSGEGMRVSETVQCQTAVTAQCHSVLCSALVSSQTNLAPLVDMGLRVQMYTEKGDLVAETPVHFASSQLRSKEALVTVVLPRPRRVGSWLFHWLLGDTFLATLRLRTISKATLHRSLRLSATRFVIQHAGGRLSLTQGLAKDLDDVERVGPCFWVSSSEPGLASWCDLEIRARLSEPDEATGQRHQVLHQQRVLLSDGPNPVALGTLDVGSLKTMKHFELVCQNRSLGMLSLTPVPSAGFTSEGGFEPVEDFIWSATAEEQLQEKLGRLLNGP